MGERESAGEWESAQGVKMRAFLAGRRIVMGAAFLAGLALWAFSAADNALNYTQVVASVERLGTGTGCRGLPHPTIPVPADLFAMIR